MKQYCNSVQHQSQWSYCLALFLIYLSCWKGFAKYGKNFRSKLKDHCTHLGSVWKAVCSWLQTKSLITHPCFCLWKLSANQKHGSDCVQDYQELQDCTQVVLVRALPYRARKLFKKWDLEYVCEFSPFRESLVFLITESGAFWHLRYTWENYIPLKSFFSSSHIFLFCCFWIFFLIPPCVN